MNRHRTDPRTFVLYARTLLARFNVTLAVLSVLVIAGGVAFVFTPVQALGGRPPSAYQAFYATWMALIAQQVYSPPDAWYIAAIYAVYPLFGAVLLGEGIVRLGLLLFSRERGDSEWIKIMASTYRDHIVICGLGHLGGRIWQLLHARGDAVVLIEKDPNARFVAEARAAGAPVLLRDMKDDQALVDAGVAHAKTIIIASNSDIANLEVALDARRMNPKIRVLMRMFDQHLALKFKDAMGIDEAFSSTALAAPIVVDLLDATRKE